MNRKVGPPEMLNELKIVRNRMICNRHADLGVEVIGSLGQVTNAPRFWPGAMGQACGSRSDRERHGCGVTAMPESGST